MKCKLFHPDRGESSFFSDNLTTILSELVREGCTKWYARADGMQSITDDFEYVIIVPAYPNKEKVKKLQEKIRRFNEV